MKLIAESRKFSTRARPYLISKEKHKNWFFVEIDKDGFTNDLYPQVPGTPYINTNRQIAIHAWCEEQCLSTGGIWAQAGILEYGFRREEDAVMFALRWC